MPAISLSEAARLANVNPSTITRAVKAGRLSVRVLDNGRKAVDPVELERAFPSDRPKSFAEKTDMQKMHEHANAQLLKKAEDEIAFLRQQIRKIEQERDTLHRTLETDKQDLRSRLDASEKDRRTITLLLEDKRSRRPWWQLWSRAA